CHVADDGSENGRQCQEPLRHLRIRQLSDGVGVVAETSQCDDSRGSRTPDRAGESRRSLRGRTKRRCPWAWSRRQNSGPCGGGGRSKEKTWPSPFSLRGGDYSGERRVVHWGLCGARRHGCDRWAVGLRSTQSRRI